MPVVVNRLVKAGVAECESAVKPRQTGLVRAVVASYGLCDIYEVNPKP